MEHAAHRIVWTSCPFFFVGFAGHVRRLNKELRKNREKGESKARLKEVVVRPQKDKFQ
jgi:hypothetical protein